MGQEILIYDAFNVIKEFSRQKRKRQSVNPNDNDYKVWRLARLGDYASESARSDETNGSTRCQIGDWMERLLICLRTQARILIIISFNRVQMNWKLKNSHAILLHIHQLIFHFDFLLCCALHFLHSHFNAPQLR